jgi:hypothetical protein
VVTTDLTEKATAATDPAGKTRSDQRDGGSSQEGHGNGESRREGLGSDGSNEGDDEGGGRRGGSSRTWACVGPGKKCLTPTTGEEKVEEGGRCCWGVSAGS